MSKPDPDDQKLVEEVIAKIKQLMADMSLDAKVESVEPPDELAEALAAKPTEEETEEVERQMQTKIRELLAQTADIKQAIANQIAEAHELMHQLGPKLALAGRMTAMLEPDQGETLTEAEAVEHLSSWIDYMGKTLKATATLRKALCYAHNRIEMSGTVSIPGRQKANEDTPMVAPGDDFTQFIGKLMPPGEA